MSANDFLSPEKGCRFCNIRAAFTGEVMASSTGTDWKYSYSKSNIVKCTCVTFSRWLLEYNLHKSAKNGLAIGSALCCTALNKMGEKLCLESVAYNGYTTNTLILNTRAGKLATGLHMQ